MITCISACGYLESACQLTPSGDIPKHALQNFAEGEACATHGDRKFAI
jgi:hypothetical protein